MPSRHQTHLAHPIPQLNVVIQWVIHDTVLKESLDTVRRMFVGANIVPRLVTSI